ncbi:hypothetical protein E4U13_001238 [Claviceps humidiphila]|uniref:Uncharacterized protein n=1 Tax=Claviceps humidiphila TaxID=1294629 RepID=A0A9P7Q0I4_9HYPO|nr:hypothetical protein E4U13_001238 [Claviceps humidiphila]
MLRLPGIECREPVPPRYRAKSAPYGTYGDENPAIRTQPQITHTRPDNLIMKFLNSILTLAAMASTTQACHCRTSIYGLAYYATATCCLRTGGTMSVFICPSGPLGNGIRLEAFRNCCEEMLFTTACDD